MGWRDVGGFERVASLQSGLASAYIVRRTSFELFFAI